MKHYFRGGRVLAVGQGDKVTKLQSDRDLSSRQKKQNYDFRLLHFVRSDEWGMERYRSDDRGCDGSESLRTTFGLASPLLRLYITDLLCFDHRFTTFASGILGQTVVKRWSADGQTPKLVRSRYESDQKTDGLSSFVPTDYLPYIYDVSRRVKEHRKTATKTRIEKWISENKGDADKTVRKTTDLTSTVYQLSSAQVLPWFYLGSAFVRSCFVQCVTVP